MSRFVRRDLSARITGSYAKLQPGIAEEELSDSDPDLIAFQTSGVVKTAAEIDAQKQELVDDMQTGGLKALAVALFQVLNDVRVLKGQSPLSVAQYKNFLKGLM